MGRIADMVDNAGIPRRGVRDTLLLMTPQIMAMGASVLSAVIIARMLGATEMGRYAIAMSFAASIAAIAECGIGSTMVRYGALAHKSSDHKWLRQIVLWASAWRLLIVSVCVVAVALASPFLARHVWHDPTLTPLILTASLAAIPIAAASLPISYYQAISRFGRRVLVESLWKAATLIAIGMIAVFSFWSTQALVVAQLVASSGLMAVISLIAARDLRGTDEGTDGLSPMSRMSRLSFPKPTVVTAQRQHVEAPKLFFRNQIVLSVIATVTDQIDLWMVGAMLDPASTGIYAVAKRFSIPFQVVNTAMATAIYPRMAGMADWSKAKILLRRSLFWASVVAALGILPALLLPLVAPLLFGDSFVSSVTTGQLMCLRYCIAFVFTPIYYAAITMGLVDRIWMLQLFQLVLLVLMNFFGIPIFGTLAPAVGLIIREAVGVVLLGFMLARRLRAR